jgi:hypothetical protein
MKVAALLVLLCAHLLIGAVVCRVDGFPDFRNMFPKAVRKITRALRGFSQRVKVFEADAYFKGDWKFQDGTGPKPFNGFANRRGQMFAWFVVYDQMDDNTTTVILNYQDEVEVSSFRNTSIPNRHTYSLT